MRDQTLDNSRAVRGIISPTIRRKQESGDGREVRVVVRRDEVFEEMKQTQGRDEEWHAPEGCCGCAEEEG